MNDIPLFDVGGSAVAYIAADDEDTIYIWNGEAACYLHEEHVYGFNGEHLGWFEDGVVRDKSGYAIGFTKEACRSVTTVEPMKSVKKAKCVKAMRRVAPYRPVNKFATSALSLADFLQAGAKETWP